MTMNPDYVGRTLPPGEPYEVSRQKIREFADAIGDPSPAYRDPAAARALGHPDVVAPPTFAFAVAWGASESILADPGLRLDYNRVIHREQRFAHLRPICAGDVLVAWPVISALRPVGRNEVLTVSFRIATTAGEPVSTLTNTLVSVGTAAPRTSSDSGMDKATT